MTRTGSLYLAALAFAVGTPATLLSAQEASQPSQGTQPAATEPPRTGPGAWRQRPSRPAYRQPAGGIIRVVQPSSNPTSSASAEGAPSGLPAPAPTPSPAPSAGTSGPSAQLPAPPPSERRVGLNRFRPRNSLPMPMGLAGGVVRGDTIVLTWDDAASNETHYVIERRELLGSQWSPASERRVGANSERYEDRLTAPGNFAYRIAAGTGTGRSWFSDWLVVQAPVAGFEPPQPTPGADANPGTSQSSTLPTTTSAPPLPPAAPEGLAAMDVGQRRASVTWAPVPGATQYVLERNPMLAGGLVTLAPEQVQFMDESGAGQFEYRVRAQGPGGLSPFSPWTGVLVRDIPPQAPADLLLEDVGDHMGVRVRWQDRSDNENAFVVERQTRDGSTWTSVVSFRTLANQQLMVDEPGPGEHRYRVLAQNPDASSLPTPWATLVIAARQVESAPPPEQAPAGPDTLRALDNGLRGASLTWVDNATTESGFELDRSPAFANGRVQLATNTTSYVDSSGAGTFEYRVRALGNGANSEFTPWRTVTVADTTPAAPSGVGAELASDGRRVRLSWTDNSDNELVFRIEHQRELGDGWSATRVLSSPANATSQLDDPGPGEHRYRVASANASGVSVFSPWLGVDVPAPQADPSTIIPAMPGVVSASDQGRRASVMWTDASGNELGFEVERSPGTSARVLLGENVTGWMDNCGPGQFAYRVRSFNNAGYSDWTGWASVTVAQTAPAAPSNAQALDAGNQSDVRVTWTDNASDESGFRVERTRWSDSLSAWTDLAVELVGANTTSMVDDPGLGRYRYRIQAVNDGGPSAWAEAPVVNVSDGWTAVVKSSDTREIFVSSSLGSDANSGLSPEQPVRTLVRGYDLVRHGFPDHLRLRRGDTWRNQRVGNIYGGLDKPGRSATEPMVVYYYGDDARRPRVQTGEANHGMIIMGDGLMSHIWVIGLHLECNVRNPSDPDFRPNDPAGTQNYQSFMFFGAGENILLEDIYADWYSGQAAITRKPGPDALRNFRIRRSVFVDAYPVHGQHAGGLYATGVDGLLLEECVIDKNGWTDLVPNRYGTIFNQNVYFQPSNTNVMVRNNITARAGAAGMQLRGQSQHAFNNLSLANPIGLTAGHVQSPWPSQGWTGSMRYNVVLDAADIGVGGPNPSYRGMGISVGRAIGAVVEKNIIAHNTSARSGGGAIWFENPSQSMVVRENIVHNWTGVVDQPNEGLGVRIDQVLPSAVQFTDNVIQQPLGGSLVMSHNPESGPGGTFARNRWYSASPGDAWFNGNGTSYNYASWAQRTGETNATTTPVSFPDPNRTIRTYMASLGMEPSLERFLEEARKQSRFNWRPEFTAAAVNRYIREGFGMAEPSDSGE